jgi:glucan 1,3-beta-glucosidase
VTNNGIPQAASDITPSNPKDIITQALPQISNLQNTIYARQMDLLSHVWGNNTQDIVDTVSMPVFMVSQAIQSMNSVKDIAKTEKKEDQIKLVVMILGIIFSFIPFLDSAGPAIGLADGTFEMVAAAGNIGLAIQGIVAYPSSAPMELLSALTLGKTKTTEDFAGLAAARRAISDDDLTKIGPDVKAAEDTLTTLLTHGCFKP